MFKSTSGASTFSAGEGALVARGAWMVSQVLL